MITIRFYQELNDFLPPDLRKRDIERSLPDGATVKALIEDMGVPHTEVDLVLVNGRSAPFDLKVRPADRISVYPVFESFDIGSVTRVRPEPLRHIAFILDVHLGRLAGLLRLLGLDAVYARGLDDAEIAAQAAEQRRIVLTRDRGLLKRRRVTHGYLVRSTHAVEQAAEVVRRFDLLASLRPLTRCPKCNTPLDTVPREAVELPDFVEDEVVGRCPACHRLYWRGSHWHAIQSTIGRIRSGADRRQRP